MKWNGAQNTAIANLSSVKCSNRSFQNKVRLNLILTMDSKLYDTILPKHKIFEDLKESLQENTGAKLYNFMELRDDVLYIWNSLENCLFCLNLKHLEEHPDDTPYQVSIIYILFKSFTCNIDNVKVMLLFSCMVVCMLIIPFNL